jgi:large subunit ribosomal protein L2
MGHRITTQSRGKGGPTYRAPSHRYKAELKHIGDDTQKITGTVIDIEHDPARNAPIALVKLEDGAKVYMLVTEGLGIGESVLWSAAGEVKNGNTLTLANIPTGTYICNIEARPNDGGKFVRASGVQAVVVDKIGDRVGIRMKPFVKAGNKYHKMQNTASNWPRVRGVAMNVIDHPFGGGGHQHPGRPKTIARGTSPGRTVGHVAARRTGKSRK